MAGRRTCPAARPTPPRDEDAPSRVWPRWQARRRQVQCVLKGQHGRTYTEELTSGREGVVVEGQPEPARNMPRAQRRERILATAQQKRVWDRSAAHYDKRIEYFERNWLAGSREWLGRRAHGRTL